MQHYDANSQEARLYWRWNATTAACYNYKMNCKNCPNDWACSMSPTANSYGIRQTKYAMLMTYANIGQKGLKRFLEGELE